MSAAPPAALAAAAARVNEIRARIGALGPTAPAVTANGTAFASTLSRALGNGAATAATSSATTGIADTGGTGAGVAAARLAAMVTAAPVSAAAGPGGRTGADTGGQAVALAKSYTGVPYLWGGTDPKRGLDCSGLVQLVFDRLGVELPRTSAQQAKVGQKVDSLADARPGDLVFFGRPVHHVGVYAGDGMMVDAPRRGKTVGLHKVWDGVSAIRRVTPEAQPTTFAARSAGTSSTGNTFAPLPVETSGSIGDLLTRLVRTQTGTSSEPTPSTAADAVPMTVPKTATTTVNALIAAARGYGPGNAGGVMGSAGERQVAVPAVTVPARTVPATSVPATSAPATTAKASGAGWAGQPYADLFAAAGRTHGVEPALLSAIAKAESGYRASARSHAGAIGLMQIMPGTARDLGVDPRRPAEAVDGAARLVARYLKTYDGDVDKVLAAYNAGPGAVRKYGGVPPYAETQTYVRRVTGFWEDLR